MLRVAVLELPARWGPANPRAIEPLLAGGSKTDLVVVPELAFSGYVSPRGDFDASRFAEPIDGPAIRAVEEMARAHATTIVAPLALREGRRVYNASVIVGPSGVIEVYRKRHPWFPETWATPGPAPAPIVELAGLKVTFAICYDGHFLVDELPEEADLLVFPSAWVDEEDSRRPLLRDLARRFQIVIANANWAPGVVLVPGQGESCFVLPSGEVRVTTGPRLDLDVG